MDLTSGRLIPCLDAKAGVQKIFLAKWTKDLLYTYDTDLTVTFGANVDFYKFESNNIQYNTTIQHEDEGEIYSIDISFDLLKVDKTTSKQLSDMSDMLLVAIVVDEYGVNRVFGLDSGLDISLTEDLGSSKSSFSGYNIKLKGFQEKIYYINTIPA